jgi:hypothetical protein
VRVRGVHACVRAFFSLSHYLALFFLPLFISRSEYSFLKQKTQKSEAKASLRQRRPLVQRRAPETIWIAAQKVKKQNLTRKQGDTQPLDIGG